MSEYRFDRLNVLVVDDNTHMRALIATLLQAFGFPKVQESGSGEEAWEFLLRNPCDIVILDWVMDGMSGLDLTKQIRTSPDSPNPFVPIIMLTGHSSTGCVWTARDAGGNEFLAKPVSAKAILARVLSVIEHPRAYVRTNAYFGPCRRRRREDAYRGPNRRQDEAEGADDNESVAAAAA